MEALVGWELCGSCSRGVPMPQHSTHITCSASSFEGREEQIVSDFLHADWMIQTVIANEAG